MNPTMIGRTAEGLAARYLQSVGYEILGTNVRTRWYELDIIARRDDTIAFVEVKSRRNADFGGGEAAITLDKSRRLVRAATSWLTTQRLTNLQPRIDVIVITQATRRLHHYQSAVEAS